MTTQPTTKPATGSWAAVAVTGQAGPSARAAALGRGA
jgi:hypothetical protein